MKQAPSIQVAETGQEAAESCELNSEDSTEMLAKHGNENNDKIEAMVNREDEQTARRLYGEG